MLRLKKCSYKEMHNYYGMMEQDFNKTILPPEIVFHKALFQHQIELVVVMDDTIKVAIAYAIVCPKSLYGYAMLMYFAVMPWYRDKGLGTEAMRLIDRRYSRLQGILVEIPQGDSADAAADFFGRLGYKTVKCGPYTHSGVPTKIMARLPEGAPSPAPVMHRVIPELYTHIYSDTTVGKLINIQPAKKKLFG